MLGFLKSLIGEAPPAAKPERARDWVSVKGGSEFPCLGLDLGEVVTALLERDTPKSWSPDPIKWEKP